MEVMERKPETNQPRDDLSLRVESIDRRMETGFAEMREEFRAMRTEMKGESQAIRQEMATGFAAVRGDMKGESQAVRQEMATGFAAVRAEMAARAAMLNQTMYRLFGGMLVAWVVGVIAIIAQT